MPDPEIAPPTSETTTEVHKTSTTTGPPDEPPVLYRTYDEGTRRRLMYMLVGGFFSYSILLAVLMAAYGWNLSPTANAIVIMTLQAVISAMTAATAYYYGTTMGSAQKSQAISDLQAKQNP